MKVSNLPDDLDRLTGPDRDLRRVAHLVFLDDGTLVVALNRPGPGQETKLHVLPPGAQALQPVPGFATVDGLWPAGDRALVQRQEALWLVTAAGVSRRVVDLPQGTASVVVSWCAGGVRVGVIVAAARSETGPKVFPEARDEVTLMTHAPAEGWVERARIPWGSGGLSMSADGRRLAWREPLNTVPEEAMRGEFRGLDCDGGEVIAFTSGAGKARAVRVHPEGRGLVYEANHARERPVTTHTRLWWLPWSGGEPLALPAGGQAGGRFGWGGDGDSLWVTVAQRTAAVTRVVTLAGRQIGLWKHAASSHVAWRDGEPAFETEGADRYPELVVGGRTVAIPQVEDYDDFRCTVHAWTAADGLAVEGVLYERRGTPGAAPLIVRAHGGPAAEVLATRGEAVRFRHLLRAGYRVFVPAFRGSLGFGDAFAAANIGCQGVKDLDDIVTGIDHLAAQGLADPQQVGITGGSFGGYMTLRALAVSDRFRAGVALYGFVDNRWMTLETGDFTYETEYIGTVTWPRSEAALASDVFSHLGRIQAPLLLLHGEADPICPWSQSLVTFRALEARGVATGLVVYPGEGHGLKQDDHRRDSARRALAWFRQHLPAR